jgi:3'-phosphoadenosine 5'-phosphosulfate (PAPS) 3'-phosphatase
MQKLLIFLVEMTAVASKQGVTKLLEVTKRGCDELQTLVRSIYDAIDDETRKEKADRSMFSVADGLVQHALTRWLFSGKVKHIVGEEDGAQMNFESRPYTVDSMAVPERLWDDIDRLRSSLNALAGQLDGADDAAALVDTVFIDPIDGTREFCSGLGEQCSICVGFAREKRAVGGVVYRPLSVPVSWAAGCASEEYACGELNRADVPVRGGLLTSNGGVSDWLVALMKAAALERVPSGGAGNKMLMLLEGHGDVYCQDRGVSRWDTCAAEAILDAYGGLLIQLAPFVADSSRQVRYNYARSERNLDFVPSLAALSPYNAAIKVERNAPEQLATSVDQVLPYSNLNGLLAAADAAMLGALHAHMQSIDASICPSYN